MKTLVLMALGAVLVGCATPQVVLDQAKNGAAVTGELSGAIGEFSRRVAVIDAERRADLERLKSRNLESRTQFASSAEIYRLAGNTAQTELFNRWRSSADVISKAQADAAAELARYSASLEKLMQPLPPIEKDLGALQRSFTELATDVRPADRVRAAAAVLQAARAASAPTMTAPKPAAAASAAQ